MLDVVENLEQIVSCLDEIQRLKENHSSAMQEVEYRISDILHLIELNDIPDSCCKKIIAELKRLREIRRDLKNQHEVLRTFETHKAKLTADNSRFMFSSEIGKTVKRLGSTYNNRIYTKEEIDAFLKPLRGRPKKEETICLLENAEGLRINNDSQWSTTELNVNNES